MWTVYIINVLSPAILNRFPGIGFGWIGYSVLDVSLIQVNPAPGKQQTLRVMNGYDWKYGLSLAGSLALAGVPLGVLFFALGGGLDWRLNLVAVGMDAS